MYNFDYEAYVNDIDKKDEEDGPPINYPRQAGFYQSCLWYVCSLGKSLKETEILQQEKIERLETQIAFLENQLRNTLARSDFESVQDELYSI